MGACKRRGGGRAYNPRCKLSVEIGLASERREREEGGGVRKFERLGVTPHLSSCGPLSQKAQNKSISKVDSSGRHI